MFRILTAKVASGFEDRRTMLDEWSEAHFDHITVGEYIKIVYRFVAIECESALAYYSASKAAQHHKKFKDIQEVVEFRKNLSSL